MVAVIDLIVAENRTMKMTLHPALVLHRFYVAVLAMNLALKALCA